MTHHRVAILGTGAMGTAIARRLLSQGVEVTVWNRSPDKSDSLREAGATVASTAAAAIASSPLVLSCLINSSVLTSILRDTEAIAALDGATIVDTSTAAPSDVLRLREQLDVTGAGQLDGKLMFYPGQVGSPAAILYVAGPDGLYRRHAEVLALIGKPVHVGTNIEAASVIYNAVWTFYYSGLFGYLEALAFARRSGLDPRVFVESVIVSIDDLREHLRDATRRIVENDLSGDQAAVEIYIEGFQTMAEAFIDVGLRSRMLETLKALSQVAEKAGYGRADISAVTASVLAEETTPDRP